MSCFLEQRTHFDWSRELIWKWIEESERERGWSVRGALKERGTVKSLRVLGTEILTMDQVMTSLPKTPAALFPDLWRKERKTYRDKCMKRETTSIGFNGFQSQQDYHTRKIPVKWPVLVLLHSSFPLCLSLILTTVKMSVTSLVHFLLSPLQTFLSWTRLGFGSSEEREKERERKENQHPYSHFPPSSFFHRTKSAMLPLFLATISNNIIMIQSSRELIPSLSKIFPPLLSHFVFQRHNH